MNQLHALNDKELSESLLSLRKEERVLTLAVLLHLNEIEERKLHLMEGYSSMFFYCTEKLGYSESGASRRIRTARCLKDFPLCGELLEKGEVNLSTVSRVASLLTSENCEEVLSSIIGKSQSEVDVIVAGYQPKSVLREVIKPVALKVVTKEQPLFLTKSFCNPSGCELHENARELDEVREEVVVETRFEVRFSVKEETRRKLERVQSLMSSKFPKGASLEGVMEELLDEFLEKHSPEKKVERRVKRQVKASAERLKVSSEEVSVTAAKANVSAAMVTESAAKVKHGRHIPAAVRDAVLVRDKGCCSFVGSDGRKCCSKWDLEIDHIQPYSCGGGNEVDNLRVVCRAHNQLLAREYFGKEFMERKFG